jgi:predicted nucleic acid-binding Zn finger protein
MEGHFAWEVLGGLTEGRLGKSVCVHVCGITQAKAKEQFKQIAMFLCRKRKQKTLTKHYQENLGWSVF